MAKVIKTRKTKFLMLIQSSSNSAEFVDFSELLTAITMPTASVTTVDASTFNDDVDVLVTVSSDPGAYVFSLNDASEGTAATKIKKLLNSRGKQAILFVAKTDGVFTAPTLPTFVANVLGFTLPASPYAYSFFQQSIEIQNSDTGLANKEIFRKTINAKAIGPQIEYYLGETNPLPTP